MMSLTAITRCTRVLKPYQPRNVAHCLCKASTSPASCPMDVFEKDQTSAKPYESMPGPGGIYNIPYIGFLFHLKPFGNYTTGTIHRLLDDLMDRYGPTFKLRTNIPSVIVTDPKDVATIKRNEGKYPVRPDLEILDTYYKRTGHTPNLESLQGPDWWTVRQPVQKMLLRPNAVSQYLPMMNEVADDFMEMLTSDHFKKYDAEETFMSYMAETAGTAIFNRRLGFLDKVQSEETKKMEQATLNMFDLILKTLVGSSNAFRFVRSKDYRTFESSLNYLRKLTTEYGRMSKEDVETKKRLGTFNSDEPNMLMSLLKDTTCTEERAILTLQGLYFASIDSSASGLQMVLHTLAKHQDKQEKLRKEIFNVLGDDKHVTQQHLNKMPYLKACVKEVYRCWGLIPFGPGRILPVDVILGGYNVPAGVQIHYYNAVSCRDESIFENASNYEPERWLRQNKKTSVDVGEDGGDKDSSWAVLPFGVGLRSCPGRRLFEQELFLLLTKLLQKMRVGLEPESVDAEFEYRLFLKSVKPIKFTYTPLESRT